MDKKCYWREIEARNYGEEVGFTCKCNIDNETCEALRLFLRDRYGLVNITTEYPIGDGAYRKLSNCTVNPCIPKEYNVED